VIQYVWQSEVKINNSATRVMAKFKLLRRVLTKWLVQTKTDDQTMQTMQQCSEFHWQVRRKQSSLPPRAEF
jgi:hypothetical protein